MNYSENAKGMQLGATSPSQSKLTLSGANVNKYYYQQTKLPNMNNEELKKMANYATLLYQAIPAGLSRLKETVLYSSIDLGLYHKYGICGKKLNKAITFVTTIPVVDDLDCDEMCSWMIHSREYLDYWN